MKNTQDWNNHLKRVYESHPNLTLKQAMSEASKTYNSKNQNKKYNGEGIYQSAINSINRLTGSNARIEDALTKPPSRGAPVVPDGPSMMTCSLNSRPSRCAAAPRGRP